MSYMNEKKPPWKVVNQARKEQRKKWKEEKLIKKFTKQEAKTQPAEPTPTDISDEDISTLTIAIPGSILENAQSQELRTYLAGQIARAACIFQVDEIVVFDDFGGAIDGKESSIEDDHGFKKTRHSSLQLGRLLQYMECPQYLRKFFFPMHKDLQYVGLLNPLDAPHHLRMYNKFKFREGVVSSIPVKSGHGSLINIGLQKEVHVDKLLTPGLRCTVKLLPETNTKKMKGVVVSPLTPRKETGVYWGYNVRLAESLSRVFSQCPYEKGYDLLIGTSDKGETIDTFKSPKYNHALIVFGGLQGLEVVLEADESFTTDNPANLFDYYLNTLPEQGSRTLRTEEAVLVTLASLRSKLEPNHRPMLFTQQEEIAQSEETGSTPLSATNHVKKQKVIHEGNPLEMPVKSSSENLGRFD